MTDPFFIERLQERLALPLPGDSAHRQMKARQVDGSSIRFRPAGDPKPGAVLILFYQDERGGWRFPLIQRPDYNGVHGGQISLPGGKKEPEDSDLIITALRESNEEIGAQTDAIEVIGSLSSFFVAASNYQVLPVIGYSQNRPDFVADQKEVAEVIEAPVEQLLDDSRRKEKQIEVRNFPLIAPYFDIDDRFVWGATAMMLSELQTILKDL